MISPRQVYVVYPNDWQDGPAGKNVMVNFIYCHMTATLPCYSMNSEWNALSGG